ncbi:MAG: 16S rRNA (uracil(1498)-N(3))-methyltransferase [Gammaproteobacteria bacterium]|nr:16S rRNA (uracil(1498)-N(3))-methyltransferase [Gammaproteobacteria bacterium]
MRETRIFVDQPQPGPGLVTLAGQQAKHVCRVLRMKAGQTLTVFDGTGNAYPATIERVAGDTVDLRLGSGTMIDRESTLKITLAMSLVRGERMDLIVQKATELGVSEIVPIQSTRSIVQLGRERAAKRQQHWRRIIISACEQCGRNRLPVIHPVTTYADWLRRIVKAEPGELRLLADPGIGRAFEHRETAVTRIQLLIGPEGGFTEAEIALATENDFRPVLLGPRTLRAETAAISMLSVMQWQMGDLRSS